MSPKTREIIHDIAVAVIPMSLLSKLYSCEEMSHRLLFKDEQSRLDRLKMNLHLFICQACINYKKQMDAVDKNIEHLDPSGPSDATISEEQLQKLQQKIIQDHSASR